MKEIRYFHIEIKQKVYKFIKKLNKKNRKICFKKINFLGLNPVPKNKKHILDVNKNSFLCELAVDKIRIYYELTQGKTIINEIVYLGKVEVKDASNSHKSGNKKNYSRQQKDINKMKKDFKK